MASESVIEDMGLRRKWGEIPVGSKSTEAMLPIVASAKNLRPYRSAASNEHIQSLQRDGSDACLAWLRLVSISCLRPLRPKHMTICLAIR
jgi:hypothetical protein